MYFFLGFPSAKRHKIDIQLLESPIPAATIATATKSVKCRYLGNQVWYYRSAGTKTTVKQIWKKSEKIDPTKKFKQKITPNKIRKLNPPPQKKKKMDNKIKTKSQKII